MEIEIIAVGKIKDPAYSQKIEEYAGRIKHDCRLEAVEIKDSDPKGEGAKIVDHLRRDLGRVFLLDEKGKHYTSVGFAQKLTAISSKIIFIVGGPFGLSEEVKQKADELIALSSMTFTHEIARLLLMEQLYRAMTIIKNRRYHNA